MGLQLQLIVFAVKNYKIIFKRCLFGGVTALEITFNNNYLKHDKHERYQLMILKKCSVKNIILKQI